jgi:predicted RNase H-like HicB family nuclease
VLAFDNGETAMSAYVIRTVWDGEAGVWVAESDDVPGLVAEAPTPAELEGKLKLLVPELLELNAPNALKEKGLEIAVRFEHESRIGLAAA